MTGFASKRQAAWDKFSDPWNGVGLWKEIENTLIQPTKYTTETTYKAVGYWVLYKEATIKTRFGVCYKPTKDQIRNTELLLGWAWEDA